MFSTRFSRPVLALLPLIIFGTLAVSLAADEELVRLDLGGSEVGPFKPEGGGTLPLAVPNEVVVTDPNSVTIEENFDSGSRAVEGRSLVLRKETPDGECGVDFVFSPSGGGPQPSLLILETELVFVSAGQSGNISLHFRGPKNNLLYYLQIGAGGGLSEASGGTDRKLGFKLPLDEPCKVRVALDFHAGKASLSINSQVVGEPLPLEPLESLKSLGFKIAGSRRAFAISSLHATAN